MVPNAELDKGTAVRQQLREQGVDVVGNPTRHLRSIERQDGLIVLVEPRPYVQTDRPTFNIIFAATQDNGVTAMVQSVFPNERKSGEILPGVNVVDFRVGSILIASDGLAHVGDPHTEVLEIDFQKRKISRGTRKPGSELHTTDASNRNPRRDDSDYPIIDIMTESSRDLRNFSSGEVPAA